MLLLWGVMNLSTTSRASGGINALIMLKSFCRIRNVASGCLIRLFKSTWPAAVSAAVEGMPICLVPADRGISKTEFSIVVFFSICEGDSSLKPRINREQRQIYY